MIQRDPSREEYEHISGMGPSKVEPSNIDPVGREDSGASFSRQRRSLLKPISERLLEFRSALSPFTIDLSEHYSATLLHHPDRLRFEAHSHHPRPNKVYEADLKLIEDEKLLEGDKWDKVFGEILPQARKGLAQILGISNPESIWFSGNTHSALVALLSCMPSDAPCSILTTDREFKSAKRQFDALDKLTPVKTTRFAVDPPESFTERFIEEIKHGPQRQMIFFSHVFFNNGRVVEDLNAIAEAVRRHQPNTLLVIDTYHAVGALPVNYRSIEDVAILIGGGYKYLQSGEGAGFVVVPPKFSREPWITSWFAEFGELSKAGSGLLFPEGGIRLAGATPDPHGIYRLAAACEWRHEVGLDPMSTHRHVRANQTYFLAHLEERSYGPFSRDNPMLPARFRLEQAGPILASFGHFLSFKVGDEARAQELVKLLKQHEIYTDARDGVLRFGFGTYTSFDLIDRLFDRLGEIFPATH